MLVKRTICKTYKIPGIGQIATCHKFARYFKVRVPNMVLLTCNCFSKCPLATTISDEHLELGLVIEKRFNNSVVG